MEFEFDPEKSAGNLAKHGVTFEKAKALWKANDSLFAQSPYVGEDRWLVTGLIDGKHWTAIFTFRGDAIRIISVRRARDDEITGYRGQND
jgi:uncharacterized protein